MKKIFLAASMIFAATSFTAANHVNAAVVAAAKGDGQHIPSSAVPAPVMASFTATFPTATNVSWEKEKEHGQTVYQADFLLNGKSWRAVFAADGTILKSGKK